MRARRGPAPSPRPGPPSWPGPRGRVLAAVLVLVAVAASGSGRPAAADPVAAGPTVVAVAVTSPDGKALDGGGSSTAFTFDLPAGASCPGDSAEDGYRVNSFMVPAAVGAAEVAFDGLGPTPMALGGAELRQPLYALDTSSYVSAMTARAAAPGEPGPIVNLPAFDLAVFSPGDVPAGRYRIGVACTLLNEVISAWEAEIQVSEDPGDPVGLRWDVLGPAATAASGSDGTGLLVPALVAVAAVTSTLATAVLLRRRRGRTVPALREAR